MYDSRMLGMPPIKTEANANANAKANVEAEVAARQGGCHQRSRL